jgi:hypothetical protein
VTDRAKRKSGRAPKGHGPIVVGLEPLTHDALDAAVYLQNSRPPAGLGRRRPRSRHLSRIASDLELAMIEKKPKEVTDRLCLDIAAMALRILEQGDA